MTSQRAPQTTRTLERSTCTVIALCRKAERFIYSTASRAVLRTMPKVQKNKRAAPEAVDPEWQSIFLGECTRSTFEDGRGHNFRGKPGSHDFRGAKTNLDLTAVIFETKYNRHGYIIESSRYQAHKAYNVCMSQKKWAPLYLLREKRPKKKTK